MLPLICIVPLLDGCASYQKEAGDGSWNMQPTLSVRHSNESPEALYQLGRYYQGQQRHEQAIAAYQKSLASNPAYVEARNGLGVVFSQMGRYAEAIVQFRMAIQQEPAAAHIRNNLGYALFLQGLHAEAAAELEQAVKLDPSNQRAHNNLRQALEKAAQSPALTAAGAAKPAAIAVSQAPVAEPPRVAAVQPVSEPARSSLPAPNVEPARPAPPPQVQIAQSRFQAVQVAPGVYTLQEGKAAGGAAKPAAIAVSQAPVAEPPRVVAVQQVSEPAMPSLPVPNVEPARPAPPQQVQIVQSPFQAVQVAPGVYTLQEGKAAESAALPAVPLVAQARPVSRHRLEISNGNGVNGMARLVAGYLREQKDQRARLTNQKVFTVSSSRVYYRQGYLEQAQQIRDKLPGRPELVPSNDLRKDVGIQVVLGRDMASSLAHFGSNGKNISLARAGS
jgi:tetratricopeptide (TPR) repeat protein